MKLKTLLLLACCLMFVPMLAAQKTINMAWDDTQTGVKYRVYHKTSATAAYKNDCALTATVNCRDAGTVKTFAWTGALIGTHYFVVTAYAPDPANPTTVEVESPYSNEASSIVAPSPPVTLRVVSQTASATRKDATLIAETNLPAKAVVQYALGGLYWQTATSTTTVPTTSHTVLLTKLRPHSTYTYKWYMSGEDGQAAITEGSFTTY